MNTQPPLSPVEVYLDKRVWDNADGRWMQDQLAVAGVQAVICTVSGPPMFAVATSTRTPSRPAPSAPKEIP